MSFTFEVRVHQSEADWFDVVEETVYGHTGTGGTWTQVGDHRTLRVPLNSSGVLRFTNGGVFVAFAVGVLGNQNVWTDIATNLAVGDTGVVIHPTWYGDGPRNTTGRDWNNARSTTATDSTGHKLFIAVTGTGDTQTVDITFA